VGRLSTRRLVFTRSNHFANFNNRNENFIWLIIKILNMKILESASKMVFLLITITACVGFFIGVLSENNFMILAGSAFTFYFANKGENKPYAGK